MNYWFACLSLLKIFLEINFAGGISKKENEESYLHVYRWIFKGFFLSGLMVLVFITEAMSARIV